ncbi:hypothetical protein [Pseudarthrobacter sp. NamB4]|uniref:hypothetical protein n=1 Tax=Pseudarthrobacter sp. NamB4 TaxID=2576837 RepID=UPI0010FEB080|nr:hypothetical protein FDW81_03385 [Pseudarthrobacter sp. NamB4]
MAAESPDALHSPDDGAGAAGEEADVPGDGSADDGGADVASGLAVPLAGPVAAGVVDCVCGWLGLHALSISAAAAAAVVMANPWKIC